MAAVTEELNQKRIRKKSQAYAAREHIKLTF